MTLLYISTLREGVIFVAFLPVVDGHAAMTRTRLGPAESLDLDRTVMQAFRDYTAQTYPVRQEEACDLNLTNHSHRD